VCRTRVGASRQTCCAVFLSPFYHAGLYAGDGHVLEARPQGVSRNDLRGRERSCVVVPAPEGKGAEALTWAEGEIGDRFDRAEP